eukprot:CAMPEP_0184661014 /NCGR_PEP_ID=MMETSP0308-20130426/36590_1 /TAXON_ID=38269 /ORGANISM="Gloeochaete witrockiana, Strain SAG 46.84" /LENGTH=44 /DNA_ID= /DNA_START= /DNA_END= /DNA_ORIENTATION=
MGEDDGGGPWGGVVRDEEEGCSRGSAVMDVSLNVGGEGARGVLV